MSESLTIAFDPHLSHKTPKSRLDNYTETIFNKMEQFLNIPSDYYLITGDLFHSVNTPKSFITKTVEFFEQYKNKQIYSVSGNHDVHFSDSNYIKESPLGVLFATQFVKPLTILLTEDYEIIGLNYGEEYKYPKTDKIRVLVAHSFLNYGKDIEKIEEKYCMNFNYCFLGHEHKQYPDMKVGNTKIIRAGSLSRLTSKTEDMCRKSVEVARLYEGNVEKIALKIQEDVFNKEYHKVRKEITEEKKEIDWDKAFQSVKLDKIEDVIEKIEGEEEIKKKFLEMYYENK